MPVIARAYRAPSKDGTPFSAGCIQATRLSIGQTYRAKQDEPASRRTKLIDVYLGSKNKVETHTISIPVAPACTFSETKGSKASVPVKVTANFGNVLPGHIHRSEVQSVNSVVIPSGASTEAQDTQGRNVAVASVDAFGILRSSVNNIEISLDNNKRLMQHQAYGETSWSGVELNATPSTLNAVTAHFSSRTIKAYDLNAGKFTHAFLSALSPLAVRYVNVSTVLCAESNFASLYDLRCNKCQGRVSPSKGFLYGLAFPSSNIASGTLSPNKKEHADISNIFLAAGEDRIVYAVDIRNWKIRHRWRAPLKYEAIQLLSSPTMPTACYAVGLDNDILCGHWKSTSNGRSNDIDKSYRNILFQNHHCGFRGDSRWIGISMLTDTRSYDMECRDVIVAASESVSLYVVENSDNMQITH